MSQIFEAPIIFTGESVRAILAGRKTQTRRLVNLKKLRVRVERDIPSDLPEVFPHATARVGFYPALIWDGGAIGAVLRNGMFGLKPGDFHFLCPYAQGETHLGHYGPNDQRWTVTPLESRLWVRESWGHDSGGKLWFAASCEPGNSPHFGWRSPLFLKRVDARIHLTVTSVRLERLHKISEEDAIAEGVEPFYARFPAFKDQCLTSGERAEDSPYRASYAVTWDEINGDKALWKDNPWVWTISFCREAT